MVLDRSGQVGAKSQFETATTAVSCVVARYDDHSSECGCGALGRPFRPRLQCGNGIPPMQYVVRVRVQAAIFLLRVDPRKGQHDCPAVRLLRRAAPRHDAAAKSAREAEAPSDSSMFQAFSRRIHPPLLDFVLVSTESGCRGTEFLVREILPTASWPVAIGPKLAEVSRTDRPSPTS